jgi:hypothetical protein
MKFLPHEPISGVCDGVSYVGYEVPTAVAMKSSIFWDITLCSPLKVNLCVSKKHIASIFSVDEQAKQETRMMQAALLVEDGSDMLLHNVN